MTLSILEILYIVLIIFSSIIWTLLILILIRVFKILWPVLEITDYYTKIKWFFSMYSQIPNIIKEILKEKFKWKKEEEKVEK